MTRVFVYGSLLAGESNHGLLAGAQLVGPAALPAGYALYDLGDFPGLIVAAGGAPIVGEVYEVDAATLAALDELEDHPAYYVRSPIRLADGGHAETYLLTAAQVAGAPLVASGDWRAYRTTERRRA
jgi:gamma-glutamylcyclotransferase (GGCT)/AIG2-like uncharacterized protein YtfP